MKGRVVYKGDTKGISKRVLFFSADKWHHPFPFEDNLGFVDYLKGEFLSLEVCFVQRGVKIH